MAFTHSLSKPKGMSYHDFYQGLDKFVTRIAPQKGYKAQYASAGAGAEVVYVFNIISLVLSFIVLVTVVCHFRNRGFSERPSFRLSGSIALADILHSVMMILMHQTDVVVKLSPMQLRIVWFFVLGSLFTSLFITDCIALQLHLTVIYKKERLAKKLNPWYELIGWTLGFVTVHPILYICQDLNWFNGPNALIFVDTSVQAITLKIWAMYIWLLLGILYCMVISIMVGIQLMSMLKGTRRTPMNFREGGGGGGSRNNAKEDNDEDHDTNVVNPNNNNNHHNNNNNDINFDVLSTTASTNPINLCTKQQHPKYSIDDEEDQTEYFNSELSNTMIETNATAFTLDERDMTTTNNNNNNININIDDIKLPNLENLKQVPLGYHNNKNPSDSDAKAGPVNTKTTDKSH
ncbi:hypothetical protein H4219_005475 [Mycoemilia scoparia]|uniref:Uncharacterized protein n=1 Tax=Mycoemilia scoparia TaxID=417184 RepID=A0A9W7ZMS7_9FUNG|nr:hypothetical protein H4219_005475 [Mycoemilia scoparia]